MATKMNRARRRTAHQVGVYTPGPPHCSRAKMSPQQTEKTRTATDGTLPGPCWPMIFSTQ